MADSSSDDFCLFYDDDDDEELHQSDEDNFKPTPEVIPKAGPEFDVRDVKLPIMLPEADRSPVSAATPALDVQVYIKRETEDDDGFEDMNQDVSLFVKEETFLVEEAPSMACEGIQKAEVIYEPYAEVYDTTSVDNTESNTTSIQDIISQDIKLQMTPVVLVKDLNKYPTKYDDNNSLLVVARTKKKRKKVLRYSCVHCELKFHLRACLQKHMNDVMFGTLALKKKKVSPVIRFDVEEVLSKESSVIEDLCKRSSVVILEDVAEDTKLRPHRCKICHMNFESKTELREHLFIKIYSMLLQNQLLGIKKKYSGGVKKLFNMKRFFYRRNKVKSRRHINADPDKIKKFRQKTKQHINGLTNDGVCTEIINISQDKHNNSATQENNRNKLAELKEAFSLYKPSTGLNVIKLGGDKSTSVPTVQRKEFVSVNIDNNVCGNEIND